MYDEFIYGYHKLNQNVGVNKPYIECLGILGSPTGQHFSTPVGGKDFHHIFYYVRFLESSNLGFAAFLLMAS